MDCPYCETSKGRMLLHRHLVDEHGDEFEQEGTVYRIGCPYCEEAAEVDVGEAPGVDEDEAGEYADDVVVMAFDVLLDHLESEHRT